MNAAYNFQIPIDYLKRFLIILIIAPNLLFAQNNKQEIIKDLDLKYEHYSKIAQKMWNNPELGYLEKQSVALLIKELKNEGFKIDAGVADIPTAFMASYGSGHPMIGILGEYDALPGMSQKASTNKEAIVEGAPGHGCGHHLLGTAALAAAISVKDWLKKSGQSGTVIFYGTPAEEGGSGKVYMGRAGAFNDLDAIITWHPAGQNNASPHTNLATISGRFRFKGISSHAAMSPEHGRSALDGVEAMNNMVNMLREHTTEPTRIHYVITDGGMAPNIVPAEAEVYYVARHENRDELKAVWNRIIKAAEGAAMGTETEMTFEVVGGTYNILPNEAFSKIMNSNLEIVGGVNYDEKEKEFATALQKTLGTTKKPETAAEVQPMAFSHGKASSDVGDVSWIAPTASMVAATWVPGTPAHSWQAVAAGGTSIGNKGMMVAAKTMALTAIDLMHNPSALKAIKIEFNERKGPDFKYEALLGDREPPLDYRK